MRLRLLALLNLLLMVGASLNGWAQEPTPKEQQYQDLVNGYFSHYEQGQMDSAEICLAQALEVIPDAPSNFMLRGNLAELLVARGDTLGAIKELSIALGDYPGVEVLRSRRAELLEESGRYNEALLDLDELVSNAPNKEVRRYNRARVRSKLGLYDGATQDLSYIIQNNDNAYLPRISLAKVEEQRGNLLEAERLLTYLIETYPTTPIAYRRKAELLLKQNRKAEALENIRHVINELTPLTYEDYLIRAKIWLLYGEEDVAEKDFLKAKELGATDKYIDLTKREAEHLRTL